MTEICLLCLKNDNNLIKISEHDENSKEILNQLSNCVPEVEWNLNIICQYCQANLNKAYNFKLLCISSYLSWKKTVSAVIKSNENSPNSNDNFSKENDINIAFGCFECDKIFKNKTVLDDHIEKEHSSTKRIQNVKHFINNFNKKQLPELYSAATDDFLENDEGESEDGKDCEVVSKSTPAPNGKIKRGQKAKKRGLRKKCFACEICAKPYVTKNGLDRHFNVCKTNKSKDDDKKEQETLEKDIQSRNDIRTENIDHLEDIDPSIPPTCGRCGTTFCNKYLLKRHLQNVHATEKKFKCDLCDRTFASPVYLNAHKRYHAGDRSHICSFCGKGFITASDLYHHEKIHANKRAYRCEICPKAFNTSSDLHKHKICVHADRSEWKYVCTFCQRRFPLKTNLDTHTKTHTGEKNYMCHLCDRRCINKSVLTRHIETHSNVVAYKCDLCMQGYKYRKSLDIHLAKMHGVGTAKVPERVKKFFCHLCPKSFFANNKLQKHIRSHSGERPYRCPNCEKSFVDKSYVKQHLKTAHNIVYIKVEY